jgi:hypothetical protein
MKGMGIMKTSLTRRLMPLLFVIALLASVMPTIPVRSEVLPEVDVLAFGDSYTAGTGAFDADICGRSDNYSYPQIFTNILNADGFHAVLGNHACIGAVSSEIIDQVNNTNSEVKMAADVVLVSTVGNDLNFATIAGACLVQYVSDACSILLAQSSDNLVYKVTGLTSSVLATIASQTRDDVKIVLVGYPLLVCDSISSVAPGTKLVRDTIRQIGNDVAEWQKHTVDTLNESDPGKYFFHDLRPVYQGKEICSAGSTNPSSYDPLLNPSGWVQTLNGWQETGPFQHWYHPNISGNFRTASGLQAVTSIFHSNPGLGNGGGGGSTYTIPKLRNDLVAYEYGTKEFMVGVSKDNSFKLTQPWLGGIQLPQAFGEGDFNGDGCTDIVSWEPTNSQFMVGISDCRDGFAWQRWISGIQKPGAFAVGDVTCDGRDDIISWESSDASIRVGKSTGSSFTWGAPWLTNISKPVFLDAGDFNRDGCDDIVSFEKTNGNQVMVGLSVGNDFRWQKWLGGTQVPGAFAAGDFNCDGRADIVAWEGSDSSFRVGTSTGSKFNWSSPWVSGIQKPTQFDAGDVTGDGCADIVSWEPSNGGQYMVGTSNGSSRFSWSRWMSRSVEPSVMAIGNFHRDSKTYDAYNTGANLLRNGTFESGDAYWGRTGTANKALYSNMSLSNTYALGGIKYFATNRNGGGSVYNDTAVNVTPGKTYTATVWVGSQGSSATGTFCLWGLDMNSAEKACKSYSVNKNEWKRVGVHFKSQKQHSRFRFEIYPSSGTTLLDNGRIAAQSESIEGTTKAMKPPIGGTYVGTDRFTPGLKLYPGEYMKSTTGKYFLVMQGDGNLVIRNANKKAIWSTRTNGKGTKYAVFQGDGNLVLYKNGGGAIWASGTNGRGGVKVILQNDGNLVMRRSSGSVVWATGSNQ